MTYEPAVAHRAPPPAILNHVVQYSSLDATFAALADPTRRAILERLGRGPASIGELAGPAGITLTGMRKHVQVLEAARLVTTEKMGRTRMVRLGPRSLEDASAWIDTYRSALLGRLDRFADVVARHTKEPS